MLSYVHHEVIGMHVFLVRRVVHALGFLPQLAVEFCEMSIAFDVGIDFRQVDAVGEIDRLTVKLRAADHENFLISAAR